MENLSCFLAFSINPAVPG